MKWQNPGAMRFVKEVIVSIGGNSVYIYKNTIMSLYIKNKW